MRHPEWCEYSVDNEAAEGNAGDTLHNEPKERIPAAVVGELSARQVIECALTPDHVKGVRLVLLVRDAPPGKVEQVRQLAQSGRVVQQHPHCEGVTEVGDLWHIP